MGEQSSEFAENNSWMKPLPGIEIVKQGGVLPVFDGNNFSAGDDVFLVVGPDSEIYAALDIRHVVDAKVYNHDGGGAFVEPSMHDDAKTEVSRRIEIGELPEGTRAEMKGLKENSVIAPNLWVEEERLLGGKTHIDYDQTSEDFIPD